MFESDRFADTSDGKPSKHAWQRDVITFFTLAIVYLSLIYYATVFMSETGILQLDCLVKLFADKKKAIHRQEDRNKNGIDDEVELSSNPMMKSMQQSEEMKETQDQLQDMAQAAALLKQQLQKQKKLAAQSVGTKKGRGKNKRTGKKKERKGFGSRTAEYEAADDAVGIELVLSNSTTTQAKTNARKSFMKINTENGDIYYQDEATGETSWDKPPESCEIIDYTTDTVVEKKKGTKKMKGKGRAAAAAKRQSSTGQADEGASASAGMDMYSTAQSEPDPLAEDWVEHEDGEGRKYYANRKSMETSWTRPSESGADDSVNFSLENPLARYEPGI
jgi:hypothetical protein